SSTIPDQYTTWQTYNGAMGIALGIVAAVAWGVADFLARGASRRFGADRTQLGMQLVGLFARSAWLLPAGALTAATLLPAAALQAALGSWLVLGGLRLLYRALAIGYLSLVSPVAAAFAAVTAALAIVFGDRPSAPQLVGILQPVENRRSKKA